MAKDVPESDGCFAIGGKRGPVIGDGIVIVQFARLSEPMNDCCSQGFAR